MSPNEAYKLTEPDKINEINGKKNQLYTKINSKRTYLNENDICLLNPKFLKLGKRTLISNFVKKGIIPNKISVRILKKSSIGFILLKYLKIIKIAIIL